MSGGKPACANQKMVKNEQTLLLRAWSMSKFRSGPQNISACANDFVGLCMYSVG
jgi:hypothetical protein